jgi:GTP-binding protein
MEIKNATFIISNTDYSKCPTPTLPEYAFIGRSNVGKSSLINMLCSRKGLARISVQPGKTQTINHFLINETWYLVDLPGYGYAKISKTTREQWKTMINNYLTKRENLVYTFLLIDIRISPQVKSVSDPSGTGTLIPAPPSLEVRCGNILVEALAAPVVVGTIE